MRAKEMAVGGTITQAQLRIGVDLLENISMARRVYETYLQELQRHLALGATIELGALTFNRESMLISRAERKPC
jgi:hypothetical protein